MGRFASPSVEIGYLLLPALWAGLLIGVAFIATPAKFRASSLTRPVALDVGRTTFTIWNNIEWIVLALFLPLVTFTQAGPFQAAAVGALAILLLIQSMVLLPALSSRIGTIIAGGRLPPSPDHFIYITIDSLKLFVLAAIIWKQYERIGPLIAQLR